MVLYLDDGIVAVLGKEAAKEASCQVRQDLLDAGLVEHTVKRNWVPSMQTTWLDFDLNLVKGQIFVHSDKIERLNSHLQQVEHSPTLRAKSQLV